MFVLIVLVSLVRSISLPCCCPRRLRPRVFVVVSGEVLEHFVHLTWLDGFHVRLGLLAVVLGVVVRFKV